MDGQGLVEERGLSQWPLGPQVCGLGGFGWWSRKGAVRSLMRGSSGEAVRMSVVPEGQGWPSMGGGDCRPFRVCILGLEATVSQWRRLGLGVGDLRFQ